MQIELLFGNLDDDIQKVASADWIIEVVVERLDIKKQVFEKLEKYRTPGTLITSNTSGIPIKFMNEGRTEDFQKHFCGTHFFNPPRYYKTISKSFLDQTHHLKYWTSLIVMVNNF